MILILAKTIENWDEDFFSRIQSPADHPDMGRVVTKFDQTLVREHINWSFRIEYCHDRQRLRMVRIRRRERLLYLARVYKKENTREYGYPS